MGRQQLPHGCGPASRSMRQPPQPRNVPRSGASCRVARTGRIVWLPSQGCQRSGGLSLPLPLSGPRSLEEAFPLNVKGLARDEWPNHGSHGGVRERLGPLCLSRNPARACPLRRKCPESVEVAIQLANTEVTGPYTRFNEDSARPERRRPRLGPAVRSAGRGSLSWRGTPRYERIASSLTLGLSNHGR